MFKRFLARICAIMANREYLAVTIAFVSHCVRCLFGETMAARVRHYPVSLLRLAFPRYGTTDNLHCVWLANRIDYILKSKGAAPKRSPLPWNGMKPLKIGFVGALSANLVTPPSLFDGFPDHHELYIFDISLRGEHCSQFPEKRAYSVELFDLNEDYENAVCGLSRVINKRQLDMLFIAHHDFGQQRDLLDLVDTPYILNISSSSMLCNHPKVSASLVVQPRKDFFVKDGKMYSAYTGSYLGGEACWEGPFFFDGKEVSSAEIIPWEDRPPNIFFHGRLHKLESKLFLECMDCILNEDSNVKFIFAGNGEKSVAEVFSFFERRGRKEQVVYLGEFTHDHGGGSAGWKTLFENLNNARLAPNPWPVGGGSARVEAYVSGTPQVHLGMTPGEGNLFDTTGQTIVDLPFLNTELGTASGIEEYGLLCRKCLFDRDFAQLLVEQQYAVAKSNTDSARWWNENIAYYDRWLNSRGMQS